jgi:hypothetical protein
VEFTKKFRNAIQGQLKHISGQQDRGQGIIIFGYCIFFTGREE